MILQDEDITTKIENDWKRLNTLAHYQVRRLERRRRGLAGRPGRQQSRSWNNNRVSPTLTRHQALNSSPSPAAHVPLVTQRKPVPSSQEALASF